MESTAAENGLIVEKKACQFNPECPRIPLIIQKMLSNFSNSELLTLSLVNKLWNYEARSIIRKRGNLLAKINSDHPCQDLLVFALHLQEMAVVPWSGMAFNVTTQPDHIDQAPPPGVRLVMDPTYQIILDKLQWRKLSVTLDPFHFEMCYSNCPAFVLVKKILRDKCAVLEELDFNVSYQRWHIEFFAEFIPTTSRFPRLRILKLGRSAYGCTSEDWNSCMWLISHAPNLQELSHKYAIDLEEIRQQEASTLLKDFEVVPFGEPGTAIGIFRLFRFEKINLSIRRKPFYYGLADKEFSLERFHRIVPILLEISQSTLKSLLLHYTLAVPVMWYGTCMENLEELTIWVDKGRAQSRIFRLLQKFNVRGLFPRLNKVVVEVTHQYTPTPAEVDRIFEEGNLMLRDRALPDELAGSVKNLCFDQTFHDSVVPYFGQIFPNIQKISVKTRDLFIPFHTIWEQWADLEELELWMDYSCAAAYVSFGWDQVTTPHLDSNICGIFPQEFHQLREKDEQFLKKVHIVPVMPCITSFKNLRTFTLHLKPDFHSQKRDSLEFMISEFAALIAFARYPHRHVTIKTYFPDSGKEFPRDDIRPYTVVKDEEWNANRTQSWNVDPSNQTLVHKLKLLRRIDR